MPFLLPLRALIPSRSTAFFSPVSEPHTLDKSAMRNTKYLLSIVATGLLALSASAQSVPVLQENFTDSNRFLQSPPSTTAWYSSGASSGVTYTGDGKL